MADQLLQSAPVETGTIHAPHPPLTDYYATPQHKRAFLTSIFDDTAADYDRIEQWLSLGSGRWYRRQALTRAGLSTGMNTADVGVGTGLVAREALTIVGPRGRVTGIDPSPQMLRRAAENLDIEAVIATAESLPFEANTFDFLSMGYALRHVEDITAAFREFHRVLRPGAKVCILEITRPTTPLGRALLRAYLSTIANIANEFSSVSPRTPELWAYYAETIDHCVPPESVLHALAEAGFHNPRRGISCGIFSEYTGTK